MSSSFYLYAVWYTCSGHIDPPELEAVFGSAYLFRDPAVAGQLEEWKQQ
eukprot:gene7510-7024_t